MSNAKVLIIVEGEKAEPRLMKAIIQKYREVKDTNIVSFRTNINVLYKKLNREPFGDNDVVNTIRETLSDIYENENDPSKKIKIMDEIKELSQRYAETYLIFDAEPHDPEYSREHMLELLRYFNDPLENGKLYINYPTVESYRDLKIFWDEDYYDSSVDISDVHNYKQIVGDRCHETLKNVLCYSKKTFDMIVTMNLIKCNILCTGSKSIPDAGTYDNNIGETIFEKEDEKKINNDSIMILNTCVFNIVDYNPSKMLQYFDEVWKNK